VIETPEYADMLERMIRAYAKRVGDGDPVDLERMVEVRRAFDRAVVEAVRGMREAGCSWREVAEGLGTTRQSAQMTYGRRSVDTGSGAA
jgi:hypothetical protein